MNRRNFEYGTLPTTCSSLDAEEESHSHSNSDLQHHQRHQHRQFFGGGLLAKYFTGEDFSQHIQTLLNISTNVLEWYAFAVFGYLSDVLGAVFFPAFDIDGNPTSANTELIESFAVFGGAFLVRPLGGLLFGYLGDVYDRHLALLASIWLMGVATLGMACLPTYHQIGHWAYIGLTAMRLLQGISAGGQLMSSLVVGVESRPAHQWGFYGAFVVAGANLGTLLAGASVSVLRGHVAAHPLERWGWRLPNFLAGIALLVLGCLLKRYRPPQEDEVLVEELTSKEATTQEDSSTTMPLTTPKPNTTIKANPLQLAFAAANRRSLLAACMVPVLGSAGFYLSFVWMALYMYTLSPHPISSAFAINAWAIFGSIIMLFPIAGHWSDIWGRRRVMTTGGVVFGLGAPIGLRIISTGNPLWALLAQMGMGTALSLWCAPMAAWLAESFEPHIRLTSAAVGYNLGVGIFSGIAPAAATYCVDAWGYQSPGYLFGIVSLIGLTGLWVVAPAPPLRKNEEETTLPVVAEFE